MSVFAPTRLKIVYSPDMVSNSGRDASPSDRKPRLVAEALEKKDWPIAFTSPEPASRSSLSLAHDVRFVNDVLDLKRCNGFGTTSASVARSLPYTCGACYSSALIALDDGISASLTSGFHHAGPDAPRGFCTFNGLMTSALQLLTKTHVRKIAIIDCDYHYGNGTQAIIDDKKLGDSVLHISFGKTYRTRDQADEYLEKMNKLSSSLANFRPDIIFYQAGADVHIDDPYGGLLTTEEMRERDKVMFTTARELNIPLTWNLAGGYQIEPDGSIPRVVNLHTDTFEQALTVWGLIEPTQ